MSENARPPVAIRIVRPYDSEEEFLESELETVGKTSVILIGAQSRPQGVILRFEIVLQTGHVVLRGEGRVLQHKESAFRGQAGLTLRFTRLDPKSKSLVDRAAAIREARLSGSLPPTAVPTEASSSPIPDAEPTPPPARQSRPPLSRPSPKMQSPRIESRPPTAPPPPGSETPPGPLVAIPSFAPVRLPSNIPSNIPSAAPDPMLAQLLTNQTPPPPPADAAHEEPEMKTDAPPPPENENENENEASGEEIPHDEAKTRPGKIAQLIEEQAVAHAHSSATVAAPAEKETPIAPLVAPKPAKSPADTAVTSVANRDALLARLRERRASMSDDKRNEILNKPR